MIEPAPPYPGEGPYALRHVSRDPTLGHFEPRGAGQALVWATLDYSGIRLRNARLAS